MQSRNRTTLILGLLLVLAGAVLMAERLLPNFNIIPNIDWGWPWTVIATGGLLFLFGLLVNAPGMSVPAAIVSGIGGILLYQNTTGNWSSWAYMWTLIPSFVGVGIVLNALLSGRDRNDIRNGLWLILVSVTLFAIAGGLFGLGLLSTYWPVLLILWGVWLVIRPLISKRS